MLAAILAGAATLYSDTGFALGSDSDNSIDIWVNPELIEDSKQVESANISDSVTETPASNVTFTPGTGDFVQTIPDQVNPEIGTPEYEAAQKAAEEDNNISASSLRDLVAQQNTSGPLSSEMHCLAGTVYFESKSESLKGQLAVARVVLARAASSRFPNSICGVVYQRRQFSFVRGGKMPRINKSHRQWRNAVATYVSPGWKLKRVGRIDRHIFYR